MYTRVKSWNQLWALTNPLTCLVIARGLRSCTINSQAASSTIASCAFLMLALISSGSVDFSILSISVSNCAFFQLGQFNPLGGTVVDRKNLVNRHNSVPCARWMFIAATPCDCGPVGGLRNAPSIDPQSTTSKEMSKLHSFKFCCRYSFIGKGNICPAPLVEIMIFALTGLSGPYPASFKS